MAPFLHFDLFLTYSWGPFLKKGLRSGVSLALTKSGTQSKNRLSSVSQNGKYLNVGLNI